MQLKEFKVQKLFYKINSVYKELIQQNSLRCKKHDSSEESVNIIMRKYYDEGLYTIKDKNIYRTIENKVRKHNSPLTDKNKFNNTLNATPKSNFNLNKMVSCAHKQEKTNMHLIIQMNVIQN